MVIYSGFADLPIENGGSSHSFPMKNAGSFHSFPSYNMVIFYGYVAVYQRV